MVLLGKSGLTCAADVTHETVLERGMLVPQKEIVRSLVQNFVLSPSHKTSGHKTSDIRAQRSSKESILWRHPWTWSMVAFLGSLSIAYLVLFGERQPGGYTAVARDDDAG